MQDLDYQQTLDKALSYLSEFEFDKALSILYQMIDNYPFDKNLIKRVYNIEKNRNSSIGFEKICLTIFSFTSKSNDFHDYLISVIADYKTKSDSNFHPSNFDNHQIYNLFYHLGQTGFSKDIERFLIYIKSELAENSRTPESIYRYCEQLIQRKQHLQAQKELEYLLIYYAEAPCTIDVEKKLKRLKLSNRQYLT